MPVSQDRLITENPRSAGSPEITELLAGPEPAGPVPPAGEGRDIAVIDHIVDSPEDGFVPVDQAAVIAGDRRATITIDLQYVTAVQRDIVGPLALPIGAQ